MMKDLPANLTNLSSAPTTGALIDFVKDNTDSKSGFHIQTGVQFKLLMLDSFLYYHSYSLLLNLFLI